MKKGSKTKQTMMSLFMLDEDIETIEVVDLVDLLREADDLYNNGTESFCSDEQYDFIKRYVETVDPYNPFLINVGSEVRGSKVKLPHKMGSLTQVYENDTGKWVRKYDLEQSSFCISNKLDGISCLIIYDDNQFKVAFSRGDGFEGSDISRHINKMKCVPKVIHEIHTEQSASSVRAIRAEIIISRENFKILHQKGLLSRGGTKYRNPRNMVAGLMNAETNPEWVYEYIDVVTYEVVDPKTWSKETQFENLALLGFKIAPFSKLYGKELTDEFLIKLVDSQREGYPYEIDGIVIEVDNADIRSRINPTKETLNPEYARKFKLSSLDGSVEAIVKDVEIAISKTGYLKPTIIVEPVELSGVTISRCTGFNAGYISNNKIAPGAIIKLQRAGDVIPFCSAVIKPGENADEWFKKQLDAVGEWDWTDTFVDVFLVNDHPDIILEQMKFFFTSLNVPALRDGNVSKLFDAGFNSTTSVIKMSKNEMVSILGENGKKAFDGLHSALNPVPIHNLMAASGVFGRGIGTRKLKKLILASNGDYSILNSESRIVSVDGFDLKTAKLIVSGFSKWTTFFSDISDYVELEDFTKSSSGMFQGQNIVFTGFRDTSLEKIVIEQGGNIQSGVSKTTTLVVATDINGTSSKLKKAEQLGISIINVDDFRAQVQ